MNVENSLSRIRTQIKYGRISGITDSLKLLLNTYHDTDYEASILEVYTLNFLKTVGGQKEAIPLLERLLSLNIPSDLRHNAEEYFLQCKKDEELLPSEPDNYNIDFSNFMEHLRSKKIFSLHPDNKNLDNQFIINNLDKAKETAWDQNIKKPFESWNSLRTQAAKQVYSYYSTNKIKTDFVNDKVFPEIKKICEETTPEALLDFYDDIYGDLIEIARGKLVGVIPDLHEKMWSAYKNNVFPCGWRGEYPAGKLCIYIP
jgi:hypothetical protein